MTDSCSIVSRELYNRFHKYGGREDLPYRTSCIDKLYTVLYEINQLAEPKNRLIIREMLVEYTVRGATEVSKFWIAKVIFLILFGIIIVYIDIRYGWTDILTVLVVLAVIYLIYSIVKAFRGTSTKPVVENIRSFIYRIRSLYEDLMANLWNIDEYKGCCKYLSIIVYRGLARVFDDLGKGDIETATRRLKVLNKIAYIMGRSKDLGKNYDTIIANIVNNLIEIQDNIPGMLKREFASIDPTKLYEHGGKLEAILDETKCEDLWRDETLDLVKLAHYLYLYRSGDTKSKKLAREKLNDLRKDLDQSIGLEITDNIYKCLEEKFLTF